MSKTKPENGAKGAAIGCKCGSGLFRIIAWCGGHVDLTCNKCGCVIDHTEIVVEHSIKVHAPGVTCPECDPAKKGH